MTRARTASFVLLLLVTGGILVVRFADESERAPMPAPETQVTPANVTPAGTADRESSPPTVEVAQPQPASPAPGADPYFARFDASDDLLAFIESIHDAAKSGDATAMYYMFMALKRCTFEYSHFFTGRGRELTLDEALVANGGSFVLEDYFRKLHRQCQSMRAANLKPFGEADAWMQRAIDADSPLAQIWKARQLVAEGRMNGNVEQSAEAHRLALAAIRSKEPMVVFQMSQVVAERQTPAYGDVVETHAWMLAACQRGLDCTTKNIWFELDCKSDRACQPYETGVDLMRRRLGIKFDEAERRAREINAALDDDRFDELGL